MRRLPTSPWRKTNLSPFICVGGSPLKAFLQDWRLPISTISFWQAAGGVTWHKLCTDGTWQAWQFSHVCHHRGCVACLMDRKTKMQLLEKIFTHACVKAMASGRTDASMKITFAKSAGSKKNCFIKEIQPHPLPHPYCKNTNTNIMQNQL